MIVVKVGGSLFDHHMLGPGLRAYLATLGPEEIILVAGGGEVADAVRKLDRVHQLGESVSHWLALQSLVVTAELLRTLLVGTPYGVLDCLAFARADESRLGALPHSWSVTTDSIAARAAMVHGAERLILLKSVELSPEISWEEAVERGSVDRYFAKVARELRSPVQFVNFRRLLDDLA